MMFLFDILKKCISLDIIDLNYLYSNSTYLARVTGVGNKQLPRRGLLIRIISFMGHFARSFQGILNYKLIIKQNGILLYSQGVNTKSCLDPLLVHLSNAYHLEDRPGAECPFPLFWAYVLSIPFFPVVLFLFFFHRKLKESFYYAFDEYWLTYGYYIIARLLLRKNMPIGVLVSNDHLMQPRVIVKAAKDEGILTFYIQHASVFNEFPPLMFDYALLEGRDALNVYDSIGDSLTKVFLIGTPKFDKYYPLVNKNNTVRSIGVCVNKLDPIERVEELCDILRKSFLFKEIYLRPHPYDPRINLWRIVANKFNISLSNSQLESSFTFLAKIDIVFVGNSNILLEAALINVYPVFYDFSLDPKQQTYSFVKEKVFGYMNKPEAAIKKIIDLENNKTNIREKAKRYCATIGTSYDGRSSELASNIIMQIISKNKVNGKKWKRIEGVNIEAYQLMEFSEIDTQE